MEIIKQETAITVITEVQSNQAINSNHNANCSFAADKQEITVVRDVWGSVSIRSLLAIAQAHGLTIMIKSKTEISLFK